MVISTIDQKSVDRILKALGIDLKPWRPANKPPYIHPWEGSIRSLLSLVTSMMRRRRDMIRAVRVKSPSKTHKEWLAWLESIEDPEVRAIVESRAHAETWTTEFIAGSVIPRFYGTITGKPPITSLGNAATAEFVVAVLQELGVKLSVESVIRYMTTAKHPKRRRPRR